MTIRTVTIDIAGMHCASCGILVDDCMEDLDGVVSSQTELKSGRCIAVVDDRVSEVDLLAAVVEAGYTGTIVGTTVAS
jgi:copper chaperone CopZ